METTSYLWNATFGSPGVATRLEFAKPEAGAGHVVVARRAERASHKGTGSARGARRITPVSPSRPTHPLRLPMSSRWQRIWAGVLHGWGGAFGLESYDLMSLAAWRRELPASARAGARAISRPTSTMCPRS